MSKAQQTLQDEVLRQDEIIRLSETTSFRNAIRRFTRMKPEFEDDFRQEGVIAIIVALDSILAARDPRPYLFRAVCSACWNLLRAERGGWRPSRRGKPTLRPCPRRRGLGGILYRLPSREPSPVFMADLFEAWDRGTLRPDPTPGHLAKLTATEHAILHDLLVETADRNWMLDQIAAEFRRRAGRPIGHKLICAQRRALGLSVKTGDLLPEQRQQAYRRRHQFSGVRVV